MTSEDSNSNSGKPKICLQRLLTFHTESSVFLLSAFGSFFLSSVKALDYLANLYIKKIPIDVLLRVFFYFLFLQGTVPGGAGTVLAPGRVYMLAV